MRLNQHSDYALRLLMQLGANPNALCTIADIAARYGISKNHLMKVANTLGRKGILAEATEALMAVLDKYTVADLVEGNIALHDILILEIA